MTIPMDPRPSRRSGGTRWTGGRRRRTDVELLGATEAAAIAATIGRQLRAARQARRLTQTAVASRIGITHSRYGDLERGIGAGAPLGLWIAAGLAVGRPIAVTASRGLDPDPIDAGHLGAQEFLLRRARTNRIGRSFELPTTSTPTTRFIDVNLRDDRHRTLIVTEIWNRFDDLGAGSRSFKRKLIDAQAAAVIAGGEGTPYRVTGCWVLRETAANRALVRRYAAILQTDLPGSSRAWATTLLDGADPPTEPGLVWIDLAATRIFELRPRTSR